MRRQYTLVNGQLKEGADGPFRVDVYISPDPAERQELVNVLGMDEHDVASALDTEEVARAEVEGDRLFVVWKRPRHASIAQAITFEISSIGLLLDRDRLVVIQSDEAPLFEDRKLRPYRSLNELFLRQLAGSVHHFLGHLRAIKQVSREAEVRLSRSMENKILLQMFALSESLVYYIDALEANAGVLARLHNLAPKLGFSPEETELLDDVSIDNRQCQRQSEIYASVLSGLMDARGNIINNNMNVLLKNLTIINVVFLPLTLIASIGGMSEYSMMTQGMPWAISYSLFTLAMVVLGVLTWMLLNRRIERRKPESLPPPPSHR
ncbi:MAG: magnesium transporter CorA family protein [Phycisphaeraceae bacterium]|nr:magnesium transporter CorA family protein [Phycisphaeraceae bacterium]